MSKTSLRVVNRLRTSRTVRASIAVHGPTVVAALPEHPGELTRDQALALLTAAEAGLARADRELEASEHAYTAEQGDDPAVRERRDASVERAYGLLVRVRSAVHQTLGEAGLARYGLQGETPRDPAQLLAHGRNVLQLLDRHPLQQAGDLGGTFDTASIRLALGPGVADLDAALQAVATETRELQQALATRDRALAAWQDAYVAVATLVEGVYRLAGARTLAERIRPTTARAAGEEADVEPLPAPVPEPTPA